jgi:hypothetical protein
MFVTVCSKPQKKAAQIHGYFKPFIILDIPDFDGAKILVHQISSKDKNVNCPRKVNITPRSHLVDREKNIAISAIMF